MANVAHSTLTGANLHEPKGAAAATVGQVYAATGSGSGTWGKLTHANLQTTGNPFGMQLLHVRDEKPAGTASGTFTNGAWRTRTLNTSKTNEITGASLASNRITLPAGTFWIEAYAPARRVGRHQAKLRNFTDSSDTIIGNTEESGTADSATNCARVRGRFTIASSKTFELQHQCSNSASDDGLGVSGNFAVIEIYAEVMIWKIA